MNSFYSTNTASFYTFKNILIRPKKKYLLSTNNKNIMSEHNSISESLTVFFILT